MTAVHAVVVGSGIAGLTVALHAVERGCRVTLVTKDVLEHANTRFAQGGIAGVMFADDRAEDHIRDTLTAGAGLSDPEAVRVLVGEGPARIRELIALGVAFDRGEDGDFVKGLEAAHSYPRILHSGGDATGTAIEKALVARLRASAVRVIEHAFLVDIVVQGGRACGVELLVDDARRELVEADAVILATGGAGELYAHSTNPEVATGDGIAAAIRAGAEVRDLEFFQFHPTVLEGRAAAAGLEGRAAAAGLEGRAAAAGLEGRAAAAGLEGRAAAAGLGVGESFLVSEAVRGEGATLIDEHGRRFAFDSHPDGELAPRDVVARAIARQMEAQDGRAVFLDATALRPTYDDRREFLARRFPTIDRAVRERGLDWARDPIPVTPAAHYLMGGVTTDLTGRTTLPGLYAVGEVARTGVHGANRLASNSLLEGAVFGARAGDAVAEDAVSRVWPAASAESPRTNSPIPRPEATERRPAGHGGADLAEFGRAPFSRRALQELLWEDAGLVRDAGGLAHAAAVLAAWRAQPRNPHAESEFEDENLLLVATRLVAAAQDRGESVGAHFRSDDAGLPATDAAASVRPGVSVGAA